jgi:hypothetical protein
LKKQLPLAVALGAGMMALASVATVKAEPSNPGAPKCILCPLFVYKDTDANGVYDTRVRQELPPTQPDASTSTSGLWQLGSQSIVPADLYIVIRPNFENDRKRLIGGDLKSGYYPSGSALNGIRAQLWEDTSVIKGIFGDPEDTLYDADVTQCGYRSGFCGDYRLWLRPSAPDKAIVLHVNNSQGLLNSLYGWVWEQLPPDKVEIPD